MKTRRASCSEARPGQDARRLHRRGRSSSGAAGVHRQARRRWGSATAAPWPTCWRRGCRISRRPCLLRRPADAEDNGEDQGVPDGAPRREGRARQRGVAGVRGGAEGGRRAATRRSTTPAPSTASTTQRAQGRPGARCTRGLVCNLRIETRTRAYRFSGSIPAFPAQWLYGLLRALPSERLFCHCRPRGYFHSNLTPAPRRQDHTTSPYA